MTTSYKVGDVLLCHKHIGVAKFVGKLHGQDYQQLPSKSQVQIKESDIWVGLQLAEQPNINNLPLMKPHSKHKKLKAISYECLNAISFLDYFTASYGILIPRKYVHKKINAHQILTKLTLLFHTLKKTQKRNLTLTKKIKQLQSEMQTIKKVKSTSQKSLESIIYDQNGNSYHHHQKITHTTTHSYKSFNKKNESKQSHQDNDNDNDNDSTIISLDTNTNDNNNNKNIKKPTIIKSNDSHDSQDDNDHASDKAVDGVKDNHSDRNMSECDEDNVIVDEPPSTKLTKALITTHSFDPEKDVINEEDEEDYNMGHDINGNRLSHARRYSAPWDNKKLSTQEFGTDYEKMYDPYWKNSGNRNLVNGQDNNAQYNDNNNNNSNNDDDDNKHHHKNEDSTEINMLPMIKENPTTNRIYRLSRVQQNQQSMREGHKRSMSMNIVKLPRYFFEIDHEYPDLPDLPDL